MVINKEKNFISAVLYVHNNATQIVNGIKIINEALKDNFEKYEIICVNDYSTDNSVQEIKNFANGIEEAVISILNMSYYQGIEPSMNAGVDLAIGDFVFEFDSLNGDYSTETITEVYYRALKGFDIVSATPKIKMRKSSKLFYNLFNGYSNNPIKLKTEAFRIVSRRAINRVQSINKTIPYRKAIYANCGLNMDTIYYKSSINYNKNRDDEYIRKNIAIESLILFTDIAYKTTIFMTLLIIIGIIIVAGYTIFVFLRKQPVEGWTTTMLFLSIGFLGIFTIFSIIMKYLSIIIDLIFKKQKYMIESIEKIKASE
jgi:dolichol-phosphate mannosyltransferase